MFTSFGRSHHLEKSGTYSFFSKTTFFYAHFPGVGVEIILLNKGEDDGGEDSSEKSEAR